ncbi:hypothetical protein BaRGS_00020443 [Batillaria attramentaria]|uniref:Autophagy-related protein 27 n=1 Tax=Batillaria attramentaria TaxID=370345 RepID=A0ABD0KME2_9CAEN
MTHLLVVLSNYNATRYSVVIQRISVIPVAVRKTLYGVTAYMMMVPLAFLCLLTSKVVTGLSPRVGSLRQGAGSDGCTWTKDGGVIDISGLGNKDGTPRFKDVVATDGYSYSYNPCFPFQEESCTQAAVCQTDGQGSYWQAGDASSVQLQDDDSTLFYDATTDTYRSSFVKLICDQGATSPEFTAIGDTSYAEYHFELKTVCACPNGCGGGGPDVTFTVELSISIGTILVIVFSVVFIMYLVGGVIWNRTRRGATGVEMVPNITLWRALPGLTKDGCLFTFSKVRGLCSAGRHGYEEVK